MLDFVTLTCPSCGGKLKVTDQIHLLACRNCGNEHMVVRDSGTMYLTPLAQDVRQIRVGVDKTAAELAVARLSKEINELETTLEATIKRSDNAWVGPADDIKGLVYGGVITLVVWLFNLASGNGIAALFFFVVSVAAFGFAFKLDRDRTAKIQSMRSHKVGQINNELSARREQYRRNRQIAES